jgi:NAD(P)-dependent dehydrogenase (short-subunit alcohol dehydrogenase family)
MMDQRTCLITGATSGIGKAAAFELAKLGHRLILVGRNEERLRRTVDGIRGRTGNREVTAYRCDLSLIRDARSAAGRIGRDHGRIDVLINNAGARILRQQLTEEGIELTLATNHLGHFILTLSLMGPLRSSREARIINVSSGAHYGGTGAIENVRSASGYDGKRQYAESKLANVLFTYALADRLKGERVSALAVDPGCAATNFARNNGVWPWLKHRLSYLLRGQLRTPARAAETIVYLAASGDVAGVTGKYFRDKKEMRSSEISRSGAVQDALWASSVGLGGIDL